MYSKIEDIKTWVNTLIIITSLLLMPFAFWKSCEDGKNLKNRGKKGEAIVITVKGIKSDIVIFRYIIKDKKYEAMRYARSNYKAYPGEKLKIVYDSLNPENVKVVW